MCLAVTSRAIYMWYFSFAGGHIGFWPPSWKCVTYARHLARNPFHWPQKPLIWYLICLSVTSTARDMWYFSFASGHFGFWWPSWKWVPYARYLAGIHFTDLKKPWFDIEMCDISVSLAAILAAILEMSDICKVPCPESVSLTSKNPDLIPNFSIWLLQPEICDISVLLAAVLDFGRHLGNEWHMQGTLPGIRFTDLRNPWFDT